MNLKNKCLRLSKKTTYKFEKQNCLNKLPQTMNKLTKQTQIKLTIRENVVLDNDSVYETGRCLTRSVGLSLSSSLPLSLLWLCCCSAVLLYCIVAAAVLLLLLPVFIALFIAAYRLLCSVLRNATKHASICFGSLRFLTQFVNWVGPLFSPFVSKMT